MSLWLILATIVLLTGEAASRERSRLHLHLKFVGL
jgi:hypothetical protein